MSAVSEKASNLHNATPSQLVCSTFSINILDIIYCDALLEMVQSSSAAPPLSWCLFSESTALHSSETLSTAITIRLRQKQEMGQTCREQHLTGDWALHPCKTRLSVTTDNRYTDQEQKQKTSVEELRATWPLTVTASNEVRYWLSAMQHLLFFYPCNLS